MWNARNTSPDLEKSNADIAILPVGAIEQHDTHLPLGTDWMEADAIGEGIARELNAYLLPALPFSNSEAHADFRGTVSLKHETLAQVTEDLVTCLFAQGFKKVVIVNLHGGNTILKIAVRKLNTNRKDGNVLLITPGTPPISELREIFPDLDNDLHGGDYETSLMLAIDKSTVGNERHDHVPPGKSAEYFDYLPMSAMSKTGVWGKSSLASREKGEKALAIVVKRYAEHIRDTFSQIEEANQQV
jgi:creatinine amidohydrolase